MTTPVHFVAAAAVATWASLACLTLDAQSSKSHSTSAPSETTVRYRRGDPDRALASIPQAVVALPVQIKRRDITYWCWLLGHPELDRALSDADFEKFQSRDDALRATRFPRIFEAAIEIASPSPGHTVELTRTLGQNLARLRTGFLQEEPSCESGLFETIIRSGEVEIELQQLVDLRRLDSAACYPETLAAARLDVGRLIHELATSGKIGESASLVATQVVRDSLPLLATIRALEVRSVSDLIAAGQAPGLLQRLASTGAPVPRSMIVEAELRYRISCRKHAAICGRIAEANAAIIDDIAAATDGTNADVIRSQYLDLAYGPIAIPPLNINPLLDTLSLVEDADTRNAITAIARDWLLADQLRLRDAQRVFDAYQRRILADPKRDANAWRRAADRFAELHAESQRTLLPINMATISALPLESASTAQVVLDGVIANGLAKLDVQINHLDPAFSRKEVEPKDRNKSP